MSSVCTVRRASGHDGSTRGLGIGQALMAAVMEEEKTQGCARLKWDMLPANLHAQAFYRSLGGAPDTQWQGWIRCLDRLTRQCRTLPICNAGVVDATAATA